jgi:hypothetical protein
MIIALTIIVIVIAIISITNIANEANGPADDLAPVLTVMTAAISSTIIAITNPARSDW